MHGIAAQTGCLRKKPNKAWRSGKVLAFGLRSKGHRLRASLAKRRMAAADALASELFKRNASFKGA